MQLRELANLGETHESSPWTRPHSGTDSGEGSEESKQSAAFDRADRAGRAFDRKGSETR